MSVKPLECPKCKIMNPPDSEWCDCGYSFRGKVSMRNDEKRGLKSDAPGLWIRFQALLIDSFLLMPLSLVGKYFFKADLRVYESLLGFLYFIVTLSLYGQTLGYRISRLVLLTQDQSKASWIRIIIRNWTSVVSTVLAFLGVNWVSQETFTQTSAAVALVLGAAQLAIFYSSPDRRWIEDYIAGTKLFRQMK